MLIDLYNGMERRTGRTAEETDALRPGDYRLRYTLVIVSPDGHILWKKEDQGVRFPDGFTPAGQSSLAAALARARAMLGGPVEVSSLRLLSHLLLRAEGEIRDVYLVFAGPDGAEGEEAGRWLYPEEILESPALSAALSGDPFYQENRDMLARLSGEMRVPRGLYLSAQGEETEVLGIAAHAVTHVPLVICQGTGKDRGLTAVPLGRWLQPVRAGGGLRPRYTPLPEGDRDGL